MKNKAHGVVVLILLFHAANNIKLMKRVLLFVIAYMWLYFCSVSCIPTCTQLDSPNAVCSVSLLPADSCLLLNVAKEGVNVAEITVGMKTNKYIERFSQIRISATNSNSSYNEYEIYSDLSALFLQCRLYDDAIAFRYIDNVNANLHILDELTTWTLPEATKVWYFERENHWKLKSYAGLWSFCDISQFDTISSGSNIQGTPLILEYKFGFKGFVSESNLLNYSGMRLEAFGGNAIKVNFTEGADGFVVRGKCITPWRVLYIGNNLEQLVNQEIICDLASKPDSLLFPDLNYIQPGKSVWRWFPQGTGEFSEELSYVDYAAKLNFAYTTIDEGWELWPSSWEKMEQLVDYAKEKNVKVIVWKTSKELNDSTNNYSKMRLFLERLHDIGVAGIKVDFMDSEDYATIGFDIRLLEECARRKLIVNFHGCQAPAGEAYTYPNELTREGIRGMELNKMQEGYIPACHNAALPFTRFVIGHGDYTPLSFCVPGSTTFAHQLATLVCFDSPLQTIAEDPALFFTDSCIIHALDYIRAVPTVWDEVRVLPASEIGKLAILAKRRGEDWYIGILNGECVKKNVDINLSDFIQESSKVIGYVDDLTAEKIRLSMFGHRPALMERNLSIPFRIEYDIDSLSTICLAPSGGAVITILK